MIEMDNKKWSEKIKNNLNDAAYRYLEYSNIQKFFALKIVHFIKELNPQKKRRMDRSRIRTRIIS